MWALCLIILTPREHFQGLPLEFFNELNFFRDEMDSRNPFGGKVQMNPIPEIVKRMIKKDTNVLNRIKSQNYKLDADERLWTFP